MQVPFYDAFMLRNFSGDSPQEGLSSFALECVDMRCERGLGFWDMRWGGWKVWT